MLQYEMLDIIETPFVSSTSPAKSPLANEEGIFTVLRSGDANNSNNSNILVLLSIEIITLNRITNPPIIKIVFMELIILL